MTFRVAENDFRLQAIEMNNYGKLVPMDVPPLGANSLFGVSFSGRQRRAANCEAHG